jgi:hypothetical protein
MITATYPIRVRRHAGWTDTLTVEQEEPAVAPATGTVFVPIDLSGYTARMQVREYLDEDDDAPLLATLDTATTGIVIDGPAGTITLSMPDTLTGLIDAGRWVYDLRLVPLGGEAEYLIGGPFIVAPSVTTP